MTNNNTQTDNNTGIRALEVLQLPLKKALQQLLDL